MFAIFICDEGNERKEELDGTTVETSHRMEVLEFSPGSGTRYGV